MKRLWFLWLAAALMAGPGARGGESGLNVIVVVNQNSSNSLRLGNDYCEQRGVPPQNLWRMTNWTGGSINFEESDFENVLLKPLLAAIASRGLTNQAHIILLSMDIPYRVNDGDSANSTTSALFYGFKTNTIPDVGLPDTCSLPEDATNSYAFSELPFSLAPPQTADTNSFLAVMLTDTNLDEAESTLQRGAASDGSFPSATVFLEKTTDADRNVRFFNFDNAVQECRARGDNEVVRIKSDSTDFSDALGLDTGLENFSLPDSAFLAGAIADSLTSFGGDILENAGQTPLLVFLEAGASGSYGTVTEPCSFTYKFPDPMVYFYQDRGFCLAESYYQSLSDPFEGLMVGEPLSQPFAHPASGQWNSPNQGSVLSGLATFDLAFQAAETNLPLAQVDLFIDGVFFETVTNLPPTPGNTLSVTVGGDTASYTVTNGDSLATIALGLSAALNAQTNTTEVEADAVGDRVVLRSQNAAVLGSQLPLQAISAAGVAPALSAFATAAMPTFLDSTAYGYHLVDTDTNMMIPGDWLQLTFIETNGNPITLAVTNTEAGAPVTALLQTLMNQINADPALQTADGVNASDLLDLGTNTLSNYGFLINANSPGWPAALIETIFSGSADLQPMPAGPSALVDNLPDLQPRAHVYLTTGRQALPVRFTLPTSDFADGYHELTAVAYEGDSVRTETLLRRTVQFQNTALSAELTAFAADTNGDLMFAIAANTTNIARVELFSTGGCIAAATHQANVELPALLATLGVGLHPFYAIVTDNNGKQYQTATVWEQLPALQLSLTASPPMLSWSAIAGRQYTVSATTNLSASFQTVATVQAANSQVRWALPAPVANALFYRISVEGY